MTGWPLPERLDPPPVADDERVSLAAWLDFYRSTLLVKCAGLSGEQLAERSCPPSTLSLLGLVRHLAEVEHAWLGTFDGAPWEPLNSYRDSTNDDADLDETDPDRADDDLALFLSACQASRDVVVRHGLDDVSRDADETDDPPTLRWVLLHLVEEYARHDGHADLLRERIDGGVGE